LDEKSGKIVDCSVFRDLGYGRAFNLKVWCERIQHSIGENVSVWFRPVWSYSKAMLEGM
jgi:hypothetical protein